MAALFLCSRFARPRPKRVQEFVLDNGLKVLLLEDHKSPSVTFQVWYRVGSRNEKDGKSGLAHFLEHFLFKGTPTTGPEEYSRIIAKNGGRSNAFTSTDMTVYFATMSREKIHIQLDLEADRMANALLGDNLFRAGEKSHSGRAAVAHRRQSRCGARRNSERRWRTRFILTAGRWSAGWKIFKISRARTWSTSINFTTRPTMLSSSWSAILQFGRNAVQDQSGLWQYPARRRSAEDHVNEPEQRGERRVTLKKEAELPILMLFHHAPNLQSPTASRWICSQSYSPAGEFAFVSRVGLQKRLARRH